MRYFLLFYLTLNFTINAININPINVNYFNFTPLQQRNRISFIMFNAMPWVVRNFNPGNHPNFNNYMSYNRNLLLGCINNAMSSQLDCIIVYSNFIFYYAYNSMIASIITDHQWMVF